MFLRKKIIVYVERSVVCNNCEIDFGQFDQREAGAAESKSRWRKLWKNFWPGSLASKSTLGEQYFIDSEPKGEVISSKIDRLAAI